MFTTFAEKTLTISEFLALHPTISETVPKSGAGVGQSIFTGHEYDGDTDLIYMGARYYPGDRARFLSQDPAFLDIGDNAFSGKYSRPLSFHLSNPQNLNSYSYTNNNPLRFTDPEGEVIPIVPILLAYGLFSAGLDVYNLDLTHRRYPEVFSDEEKSEARFDAGLNLLLFGKGKILNSIFRKEMGAGASQIEKNFGSIFADSFGAWYDFVKETLGEKSGRSEQNSSQSDYNHPNNSQTSNNRSAQQEQGGSSSNKSYYFKTVEIEGKETQVFFAK